jgi:hypothetical protein
VQRFAALGASDARSNKRDMTNITPSIVTVHVEIVASLCDEVSVSTSFPQPLPARDREYTPRTVPW